MDLPTELDVDNEEVLKESWEATKVVPDHEQRSAFDWPIEVAMGVFHELSAVWCQLPDLLHRRPNAQAEMAFAEKQSWQAVQPFQVAAWRMKNE